MTGGVTTLVGTLEWASLDLCASVQTRDFHLLILRHGLCFMGMPWVAGGGSCQGPCRVPVHPHVCRASRPRWGQPRDANPFPARLESGLGFKSYGAQ